MTNIKILNHGDYYDPSIGEKFASLSDLVSFQAGLEIPTLPIRAELFEAHLFRGWRRGQRVDWGDSSNAS